VPQAEEVGLPECKNEIVSELLRLCIGARERQQDKIKRKSDAPGLPHDRKPVCPLQRLNSRFDNDGTPPGVCSCHNDMTHEVSAITDDPGGDLERDVEQSRHGGAVVHNRLAGA
jgi:hypothetical protein